MLSRDDLDSHLDTMQNDLDGLKEILKGDCYSLDANTLLGVCPAMINLDQDALLKVDSLSDSKITAAWLALCWG